MARWEEWKILWFNLKCKHTASIWVLNYLIKLPLKWFSQKRKRHCEFVFDYITQNDFTRFGYVWCVLGCVRKSVLVCNSAIAKLDLMEPSMCAQANNRQQCYPTSTSCYALVRAADSSLYLLNCGQLDFSPPITIAGR